MKLNQLEKMEFKKIENKCKGVIVRGNVTHFHSWVSNTRFRIVKTFQVTYQKKKSCPGCEHCGFIRELIEEIGIDNEVENMEDIEHDKLYDLIVEVDGADEPDFWLSLSESQEQDRIKFLKK